MASRIILVSGPISSGKTKFAETLAERYGFLCIRTRSIIAEKVQGRTSRKALQAAGRKLDRDTGGKWLVDDLVRTAARLEENAAIIVDAVRTQVQAEAIRAAFGSRVVHVHLTAPPSVLARRHRARSGVLKDEYGDVRADPTEYQISELGRAADIVIDTRVCSPDDVVVRVASRLGLYGRGTERLVDVLVGGQYGSEGKGQISSYLASEYGVLVRVGGPNAGHTVYAVPEPYTYHHLPSGTRHSEAKIVLGPGAVLWLQGLMKEIAGCGLSTGRLFIDPQAMVIEEADRDFETGTLARTIGSTAQGVGAATSRKVLRTAAKPPVRLARDVPELGPYMRESRLVFDDAYAARQMVFLEGTQGTGLSLHHGEYPYTTSRDTTVSGCLAEAGIAPSRVRRIILVCRTYPIRVQNPEGATSGHMVGELAWKEISRRSCIPLKELLESEKTSTTRRNRRVAEFDWVLLRRAASLNGPTDVALTFADYLSIKNREARRFEQLTDETIQFIEEIERVAMAPVSLIATRFHSRSIIDRRAW